MNGAPMEATPDPRLDADVAAMLARQAAADVRRWIACVGLVAKPGARLARIKTLWDAPVGTPAGRELDALIDAQCAAEEREWDAAELADEVEAELAAWPEQVAGG